MTDFVLISDSMLSCLMVELSLVFSVTSCSSVFFQPWLRLPVIVHYRHVLKCIRILPYCNWQDMLSGLNIGPNKHHVVRLAIMLAMDRHNAQRELTSQLISDLYRTVFSSEDIARSLNELLSSIDDIVLDTPDAHNVISSCTLVIVPCNTDLCK